MKKALLNVFTYEIKADGDELRCKVFKSPSYYMLALSILALILFAVCAVGIIRRKNSQKVKSAKIMELMQSGEVDNDRKK